VGGVPRFTRGGNAAAARAAAAAAPVPVLLARAASLGTLRADGQSVEIAMRTETFRELGGFAEELFMYLEDVELGWRAHLAGYRVVVDPEADVLHEYEFGRNPRKNYLLERNRLFFVVSAYSGRMLFLLSPLLVATELGMTAVALKEGWLGDKLSGWGWLARNAGVVRRRRRATQGLRKVRDRELARFLTPVFDPKMIPVAGVMRAANPVVRAYWSAVKKLL